MRARPGCSISGIRGSDRCWRAGSTTSSRMSCISTMWCASCPSRPFWCRPPGCSPRMTCGWPGRSTRATRDDRGFVDRPLKRRIDTAVARRALDEVVAVAAPVAKPLAAAGFSRVTTAPAPASIPTYPLASPADCTDLAYVGGSARTRASRAPRPGGLSAALRIRRAGCSSRVMAHSPAASLGIGRCFRAALSGGWTTPASRALLSGVRAVVVPSLPRLRPEGAPLAVVEAAPMAARSSAATTRDHSIWQGGLPGCSIVRRRRGRGACRRAGPVARAIRCTPPSWAVPTLRRPASAIRPSGLAECMEQRVRASHRGPPAEREDPRNCVLRLSFPGLR